MSLKLAARMVSFPAYKIADLQENDTAPHMLDLSPFVPPGTQGVLVKANRISGTGFLSCLPFESATGAFYIDGAQAGGPVLVAIKDRELHWVNTVANDDWDLFLYAYFVQKRTR